ncbi:MAG: hypothetical protein EOO52_07880 [Gammaproteobacteria bacterium]|nr:MAG: hypothetical protein EOO52_07880 [Gammaproteobacteria bacterium]
MKYSLLLLVCSSFLVTSYSSLAETIKLPVGAQSTSQQHLPKMGTSKAQVKSQFGEPLKENPAKGKPPISNWEYAEFVVYFEYDHVIHSVSKPKLSESKETVIETTDEMSEDELKLNK